MPAELNSCCSRVLIETAYTKRRFRGWRKFTHTGYSWSNLYLIRHKNMCHAKPATPTRRLTVTDKTDDATDR